MSQIGYLGWRDAEKYTSLSESSLRRLVRQGEIRAYRPTLNRTLLNREDIDKYLASVQLPAAN